MSKLYAFPLIIFVICFFSSYNTQVYGLDCTTLNVTNCINQTSRCHINFTSSPTFTCQNGTASANTCGNYTSESSCLFMNCVFDPQTNYCFPSLTSAYIVFPCNDLVDTPSSSNSLSSAAIAGIIVGTILGVSLLVGVYAYTRYGSVTTRLQNVRRKGA